MGGLEGGGEGERETAQMELQHCDYVYMQSLMGLSS